MPNALRESGSLFRDDFLDCAWRAGFPHCGLSVHGPPYLWLIAWHNGPWALLSKLLAGYYQWSPTPVLMLKTSRNRVFSVSIMGLGFNFQKLLGWRCTRAYWWWVRIKCDLFIPSGCASIDESGRAEPGYKWAGFAAHSIFICSQVCASYSLVRHSTRARREHDYHFCLLRHHAPSIKAISSWTIIPSYFSRCTILWIISLFFLARREENSLKPQHG